MPYYPEYAKRYREEHKEELRQKIKEYRDKNKEKVLKKQREYKERHKKILALKQSKKSKERYRTDPLYRQQKYDYVRQFDNYADNWNQLYRWDEDEIVISRMWQGKKLTNKEVALLLGRTISAIVTRRSQFRKAGIRVY